MTISSWQLHAHTGQDFRDLHVTAPITISKIVSIIAIMEDPGW